MRILHLVHQYLPECVGGTELYTQALVRHQMRQGHDVALFTPTSTAVLHPYAECTIEEGVPIYRLSLGKRDPASVFFSTLHQKRVHSAFVAVLAEAAPDLVHIQHLMGLPASLIKEINARQIPFVVTLHDYWYVCANAQLLTNYDNSVCGGPDRWLNCARCALARSGRAGSTYLIPAVAPIMMLRHWRLRPILENAQALIAPTEFVRQTYHQLGVAADKICVIPHGIEVPDTVTNITARPISNGRLHIVYAGGLAWQKGVHVLVEAVNQMPAEAVRLTIAGDPHAFPDYSQTLKNLADETKIHFAGRLSRDDLWSLLTKADAVVVPSLWYETASLIIQEAFAAGVPVVASRIGALAERVNDGVDGLLVVPGNVAALAAALTQLRSPDVRRRLRSGIRPVRTIEEHLAEITAVYESVTRDIMKDEG